MKTQNNYIDQPVHFDLFARGYNAFGQNPLSFMGAGKNLKNQTMFEAGVPSNFIQDGDTIVRLNVVDGYMQSDGFVSGETGWRIDSDGNVEFSSGYFRGDISAATGTFGGTVGFNNVTSGTNENELNIGTGNVKIDGANKRIIINDGSDDRVLIGYQADGF